MTRFLLLLVTILAPMLEYSLAYAAEKTPAEEAIEAYNNEANERYGRIEPQQQIDAWIQNAEERKQLLQELQSPNEERNLLDRQIQQSVQ